MHTEDKLVQMENLRPPQFRDVHMCHDVQHFR